MSGRSPHEEPFTRLSPGAAKEMVDRGGVQFIDVREPQEYAEGHASGARLVPLNTIFTEPGQISAGEPVIFICKVGQRSALAAEYAAAIGRERLYNVDGGTDAWKEAGLPLE
jgi:rhodanese-related sulfurtransferase